MSSDRVTGSHRNLKLRRPRLLTIAGSDSGGGAGIQADLKTFAALGGFGMSAITAVTAQNTLGVTDVHEVPVATVAAQIDAVFDDLGVDAVKIGMLASEAIVQTVAERLRFWREQGQAPPIVLDPVMVAKGGAPLIADPAVESLMTEVLPLATIVTPNLPEAERMTGQPVASHDERIAAGRSLAEIGSAVLIKGGHGEGAELIDILIEPLSGKVGEVEEREDDLREFRHPRIDTTSTHGTGCTLSSAIAAGLGHGRGLASAVDEAIDYLHGAIRHAAGLGSGHGPVDHSWRDLAATAS